MQKPSIFRCVGSEKQTKILQRLETRRRISRHGKHMEATTHRYSSPRPQHAEQKPPDLGTDEGSLRCSS